jgi:DNA-binding transcriptional LysR family regulator
MNLSDLEVFVAVARRGNFAAVATERDLDPSSVSRMMAKLEGSLGVRLLQRTTRRVTLTEAGEVYLAHVEPLIDELGRARDLAASITETPAARCASPRRSRSGRSGSFRCLQSFERSTQT